MSEGTNEDGRAPSHSPIPALLPLGAGHQFVLYGDACSGISGALHERTFASVNAVIRRLSPPPDFIVFTGDEIVGLTADPQELRAQWRHWLAHEMAWLDRQRTPMWHATSNHTTYDQMSEAIFAEVLGMARNGPPGHEGLSYWMRRDDLLIIFVHTLWSGLGGEGHVETDWLRATLQAHSDARHKLVVGHHPVYPINGFSGRYQREIGSEHASVFWKILVEAGVLAYVCGHILAFDVQVHQGVLQICTAGAGTAHRMPQDAEYLHCLQAALDNDGLRYQVLDERGVVRERLEWPVPRCPAERWRSLPAGVGAASFTGKLVSGQILRLRLGGRTAADGSSAQTLLSAFLPGALASLWIGVRGPEQDLTVIIGRKPGRSPHYWLGPKLGRGHQFSLELLFHADMGPGGVLYRLDEADPWSSLEAASATGPEELDWPECWSVGHAQGGPTDRRFLGTDLVVAAAVG